MAMVKHGRGKVLASQQVEPEDDSVNTEDDWSQDDQDELDEENAEADR